MEKKIPIYFDSVIVSSPLQQISETNQNLGRLKVRVFTKYGNRNGSYITEAVAQQLIDSAVQGDTPVIGFFDPSSQSWASHTGPTLASAYGYVEGFDGWQPFTDTDGITREYAVFSVILFTKYFDEAQKVLGQNQSMELNPDTITGDWAEIEGREYFVYKTAEMLGFCIIGEHEPCFSVSAFFSKDNEIEIRHENFSSLLLNLKTQVEEIENSQKGGGQPMNEFENQEVVENEATPVEENIENFENVEEEIQQEQENVEIEVLNEDNVNEEAESSENEPSEFQVLQQQFNELQASYNELQEQFNAAQATINEYSAAQETINNELETLRSQNEELQTSIQNYEALATEQENARKNELINKYAKVISEDEINAIRTDIDNYSYDELESKLAIIFANATIADEEVKKVPVLEPQESQFALLMKKYRKNN